MTFVLVVDNDESLAEKTANMLIDSGFGSGWVGNAMQAMRLLTWRCPDLMLLDRDLPGNTDNEFLRTLRNSRQFQDLPVIMLAAATDSQKDVRTRCLDAQDWIRKPFERKFLLSRVNHALARRAIHPMRRPLEQKGSFGDLCRRPRAFGEPS